VLASILFTDIVGSTEKAADLGDRRWRETVEGHHATVRAILGRYHGVEIDTAGDGFFATFEGPARAVRCAQAIVEAVRGHSSSRSVSGSIRARSRRSTGRSAGSR
jgi:class 3 adenylate cyclase